MADKLLKKLTNSVQSCYWKVSVNSKELKQAKKECIDSIDIVERCDGSNTCTLVINDPDFLFIEDNIFVEEATIDVSMGWHGDTHRVHFTGYISAIDISFPDTGFPVLSVFCLDKSHIMNRKKKKRSWDKVTNADVVKKIAQEYGFKCVVEKGYSFKKEDTISQSDSTDIEFCESLADSEREPFMCKLIDNTLYYVKKGVLKDPTSTVYYKKYPYDVISFSPKINKETIKEEVESADINTNDKSVDKATANNPNTQREVQGEAVTTKSYVYNPKKDKWE